MSSIQRYTNGLVVEQWSSGTLTGDPTPTGYTTWDAQRVATTRALTAAEAAMLAAQDTATTASTNQASTQQQVQAALAANRADQTQDGTIQTGAASINATAGPFNLAQCTTFIKQLATAISTLAGNDVNAKKELNALIRLALQQFDATN